MKENLNLLKNMIKKKGPVKYHILSYEQASYERVCFQFQFQFQFQFIDTNSQHKAELHGIYMFYFIYILHGFE